MRQPANRKKNNAGPPDIQLAENPDILASLSTADNRPSLVIGFAAETDELIANAQKKRVRKGCDWIIANHISGLPDQSVFGSDQNKASLIKEAEIIDWPDQSKQALADRLIAEIENWMTTDENLPETG